MTNPKNHSWYSIKAKAEKEASSAEIYLYEPIGYWDIPAVNFIRDVKALGAIGSIDLHINSPGGEVWDGLAIFNFLKAHPAKVNVFVDGLAASIASIIAMAGDTVTMPENAIMMIHNPWSLAIGDKNAMAKTIEQLERAGNSLAAIYHAKTGLELEEITAMMDAETWLSAEEAKAKGFADVVTPSIQMAAKFNLAAVGFKHPPAALLAGSQPSVCNEPNGEKPVPSNAEPLTPAPPLTMEALSQQAPELLAAVKKEAYEKGLKEGAKAEFERISSLEELSLPGHETLIKAFKQDGKTTAAEASIAILKAEKTLREELKATLSKETPAPIVVSKKSEAENQLSEKVLAQLPLKERCEAEFNQNKELQQLFDSAEQYFYSEKARGGRK